MALQVDLIRSVAKKIPYVEEVAADAKQKTISYVNTRKGHRVMIYCGKGTVDCTVRHPQHGRIQSVTRHVTYSNLVELLKNPPTMENQTIVAGKKRDQKEVDDGDAEFEEDNSAQMKKAKSKKNNSSAHKPEMSEVGNDSPTDKADARGTNTFWKLRHSKSFPSSATNIACFAQSHGGFVAVLDNGSCVWQGIPATVIDVIASQHNRHIAYIALGEYGQYYIRTHNHKQFYVGSAEFERSIRSSESLARLVAFGDAESYFVLFENGTRDTRALLPRTALKILAERPIYSVWIGTNLVHNANGYFIAYKGVTGCTLQTYAGLPHEVTGWMEKRQKQAKDAQIKQLVSDGDCFILRYA